jgi:hypothetical protein
MTVVARADVASRLAVATRQQFYVRLAAAGVGTAVIGFTPTYWLPLVRGTLNLSPGGALVSLQVLRVPLSTTTAWTATADWLLMVSL